MDTSAEQKLADVRRRIEAGESVSSDDVRFLLQALDDRAQQVAHLEKKNQVLSAHVLELTQEMENVRSDFSNDR